VRSSSIFFSRVLFFLVDRTDDLGVLARRIALQRRGVVPGLPVEGIGLATGVVEYGLGPAFGLGDHALGFGPGLGE
jgi:hypothetical protein